MAKTKADWMNSHWRPMMGWTYMFTCIMDFIIFPVLWSILQAQQGGEVTSQWSPLTLQGAGLYHLAMGAILGVAAWSRGQEKLAGIAGGYSGYPYTPPSFSYDQSYETTQQWPTRRPSRFKNLERPVEPPQPEL